MTTCPYCQRPSYLWGGERCDGCTPDADGNGIDDRSEASYAIQTPTLFPVEEKGWVIVGPPRWSGNTKEVVREYLRQWRQRRAASREKGWELVGSPRFGGNTKEKVRAFVKQWHQSRACRWEQAEFRRHLHPELREIGIPNA